MIPMSYMLANILSKPNTNTFAAMMASEVKVTVEAGDELTRYLADSRVETTNPLQWWVSNRSLYPNLARMAIDFHSIPGMSMHTFCLHILTVILASSVAVERSFSRGRILISHLRNRLRANTIRALMCLGDWCRQNLVSLSELADWLSRPHDNDEDDIPDLVDDDEEF